MIAITGANGLVGSFIAKRFVDEGHPVTAIVRASSDLELLDGCLKKITIREADILDVPSLIEAFQGIDTVIHAAALVSLNPRQTRRIFEVNVEGTRNVVNTSLALGVNRLIHISSVAALGRVKGVPVIDEGSKWAASKWNTDYAESKYLAELEVFRGMEEGLNVSLVNPSVVLAPTDWRKSTAQLFRYVWEERMFYAGGSLNYVDVRDVAEMVSRIYSTKQQGEKFIACAGAISYKEFFDNVGRRFNKKSPSIKINETLASLVARLETFRSWMAGTEPIITRPAARMAAQTFQYNHRKAIDVLGLQFHSLQETLDWCCEHYLRKVTTNK